MSDSVSFAGRVVVVTGGASGIGAGAAKAFAARGAAVVVLDTDVAGGRAVVHDLGAPHLFIELDVRDTTRWREALAEVAGKLGRIDIVCLNAAVMSRPRGAPIADDPIGWLNEETYRRVTSVNVDGVVLGLIASLPHLERTAGKIVITASRAGAKGYPPDPVYAMTKHAVVGLGTSVAEAASRRNVRVEVFCPTATDTPMVAPDISGQGLYDLMRPTDVGGLLADLAGSPSTGGVWLVVSDGPGPALRLFDSSAAVARAAGGE